jgi:hypothetical protein
MLCMISCLLHCKCLWWSRLHYCVRQHPHQQRVLACLQVACGLNFTVALTRNGEVLQMGRTGAENNKEHNAMWEVRFVVHC